MPRNSLRNHRLQPRIRILHGGEIALGPGKIELLEHIRESGSISIAAKQMEISYMRAWTLVQTMNACFKEPLIISSRGGKEKGGAKLTESGEQALKIYREMEKKSSIATKDSWNKLQKLLRT